MIKISRTGADEVRKIVRDIEKMGDPGRRVLIKAGDFEIDIDCEGIMLTYRNYQIMKVNGTPVINDEDDEVIYLSAEDITEVGYIRLDIETRDE